VTHDEAPFSQVADLAMTYSVVLSRDPPAGRVARLAAVTLPKTPDNPSRSTGRGESRKTGWPVCRDPYCDTYSSFADLSRLDFHNVIYYQDATQLRSYYSIALLARVSSSRVVALAASSCRGTRWVGRAG